MSKEELGDFSLILQTRTEEILHLFNSCLIKKINSFSDACDIPNIDKTLIEYTEVHADVIVCVETLGNMCMETNFYFAGGEVPADNTATAPRINLSRIRSLAKQDRLDRVKHERNQILSAMDVLKEKLKALS